MHAENNQRSPREQWDGGTSTVRSRRISAIASLRCQLRRGEGCLIKADRLRFKHSTMRAEQAHCECLRHFILSDDKRHPREMGAREVEALRTHRTVTRRLRRCGRTARSVCFPSCPRNCEAPSLPCSTKSSQPKLPGACRLPSRPKQCSACWRCARERWA